MDLSWARRPPLSIKLLGLLGGATALLLLLALSGPWLRMHALVEDSQREVARELVEAWRSLETDHRPAEFAGARVRRVDEPELAGVEERAGTDDADPDPFLRRAARRFERGAGAGDELFAGSWDGVARRYRYARAVRNESGELLGAVVLERRSPDAAARLALNSLYLVGAGLAVLVLASAVYYAIISRLVLRPLRTLTAWAESVRDGDTDVGTGVRTGARPDARPGVRSEMRADVRTGDELERLAETFDTMLDRLAEREHRLRAINAAMDVKLSDLSESNRAIDASARVKGEFVANISHELRTPLNAILGFADLLRDTARRELREIEKGGGEPPEDLRRRERYIGNITDAASSLLRMIEDVLEMAKLEAGRVSVRTEAVDIADACRGMVALIEPVAEKHRVEVSFEAPGELPAVETDPQKFQQIVFNLLSNAVRFSDPEINRGEPGRVTVRADEVQGLDADGGELRRVRVSVLDNGPGIAPEDQHRIFEKFQQLDGSPTRALEGTGLGLSICRELTAVLRGELRVDSEPGRGSMFSLTLPLWYHDEEPAPGRSDTRHDRALPEPK